MLRSLARRLRASLETSYEIWRLESVDDRLLADMGVCRDEIRARVRGR